MRIIFFGSGAFAQPTLRWLDQSEHDIAFVVTQPARGSGRGRKVKRTPIRALADDLGLTSIEPENVNEPDAIAQLVAAQSDLGLVVAFGQKLGPSVLAATRAGCINLHASLLPKFRGAAPINWAIVRGEQRSGVTVFRLTSRMDAGPILTSRWTDIKPEETAGELHDRLAAIGVDATRAAFDLFTDDQVPEGTAQDESAVTLAPKLNKADGAMDFDQLAADAAARICGLSPWPGVRVRYESQDGRFEEVVLLRARVADNPEAPSIPPGQIDERRFVAANDGFVEILEVKPTSGRTMTWPDYVNGRHVRPGDTLTSIS